MGLFVHLLPWAALDESTTSGLFVFGELGPKDVVTLIHKPRLAGWRQRLAGTSGVCAPTVITPSEARPDLDPSVFLFTDAALDGTTAPGLGGFLHGSWFHVAVSAWLVSGPLQLPINILEFITFQVAFMTFWPVAHGVPAVLFSDSLASVFAVANRSARAPLMRFVWNRLRACSALRFPWLDDSRAPASPHLRPRQPQRGHGVARLLRLTRGSALKST